MARIDVLPSIEIIRGLKGILDFYIWRGLACVRAWPRYRPAKQTEASLAAALVFGAIVKAYNQMGDIALTAYREDALDQPRTARDLYVTSQYGNLHEAGMSDFLDAIIIIRDAVVALTDLLHALDSIDTDEFVVNVDQSVLPAGASTLAEQQTHTTRLSSLVNLTAALHSVASDFLEVHVHASVLPPLAANSTNQGLIYTRLGALDDLVNALESNALDRLLVRGTNQLFTLKSVLALYETGIISGANGSFDSDPVPANEYWIVTTIVTQNTTSPTTGCALANRHDNLSVFIHEDLHAIAIAERISWTGLTVLDYQDVIRTHWPGAQAGDTISVHLTGYRMTLET